MYSNERVRLFNEKLNEELNESVVKCLWMSFCDPDKPKGKQFLGVVITNAIGIASAVDKAHRLGINPGGEILSYETDPGNINPNHFDRLLSAQELEEYGYV